MGIRETIHNMALLLKGGLNMTNTINPYSTKDSRWKWFELGVLSIRHEGFTERWNLNFNTLPQQGSPNLEAFNEGIKREKEKEII